MSERQRTDQQLAAVADRERDVFLRAGAGTGKTTVLVDRFCASALDPEVGIEGVLAFTFTERAADQLRRRVRQQLGDEIDTDRAWISTIHGFCRRVLATHPAAAGIDPRFRVLDEAEADRLAARAFESALEDLVQSGDPDALELAAANRPRTLLEMTRGAYDELRSHGDPAPELPGPPPPDPPGAIARLIEAAREAHAACAEVTKEKEVVSRERIGIAAELDPQAIPDEELLERLRGLDLLSKAGPFKEEACTGYTAALKRARSAVASQVLGPAYEQLRKLVKGFGAAYEDLKASRSALDFEDLQLKTVELLSRSDWLRDRYRGQFRHLMVDEFQDTNGLQLALIEQLRGPDTRLFLVGDEFQSIYGFRHADVDVYRREHRRFAEGKEPRGDALPLTGNFRASPELVAATNAIGAGLLNGFEPLTSSLEQPSGGDGPAVELLLTVDDRKAWEEATTELPRPHDDPSSGSKVAEARRLAGRLREIVDEGEDASDVVVLLRAFTHIATVERALADAGLDPYVVGGRGFWSQQQIEDMRCLLAVVANPLEDEALFGALASPACAVLPDTLWLLRQAALEPREDGRERRLHIWPLVRDLAEDGEPRRGNADVAELIPDDERERLREFAERLTALRGLGTEGGLEALIERVATTFDYDLQTLSREDGEARWANVRKLMRLAREFEAKEGPDLAALLEYLASRAAQRDREAEAASRAEGHAGVRVMTVHAAKGLEFGVVAVGDLGRGLQLGWSPLRVTPAEEGPDGGEAARVGVQLGRLGRPGERLHDYEDLTEQATERGAEEEGRLAYVAATRAKRRLLLSGTFPKTIKAEPDNRKPIALQLIRSLLDMDTSEREVEIPAVGDGPSGRLAVRVTEPGPGVGTTLLEKRGAAPAAAESDKTDPPLKRPETPPALTGGLSYSALSEYKNCGYRFYVQRVLGISEPEEPGAVDASDPASPQARTRYGPGVAVHDLLEWSARNGWREPDAGRVAAALAEQGLPAEDKEVERALSLVKAWLGSPLREEIADGKASAEVPFVLSVGGTLVRGSIDLLVEREDGSVLVVDYKTDRLDGRDPEDAAQRYDVQRDLYALAASARGAPVESAYVFLEQPDHPARTQFEARDLDQARSRVESLLEKLGTGSYPLTDRPHRALCHDCPARERLCAYGPDLTMRDSPEPPVSEEVESALTAARKESEEDSQMSLLDVLD